MPSALLLHNAGNYSSAEQACSQVGESVLSSVSSGLGDQLNYAGFAGTTSSDARAWVASSAGSSARIRGREVAGNCRAYSLSSRSIVSADCSTELATLCSNNNNSTLVTVSSQGLNITGTRNTKTFNFEGVPFANPPTGSLRFMPAEPYTGSKTINATSLGPACAWALQSAPLTSSGIQNVTVNSGGAGGIATSEDCLQLNVRRSLSGRADRADLHARGQRRLQVDQAQGRRVLGASSSGSR